MATNARWQNKPEKGEDRKEEGVRAGEGGGGTEEGEEHNSKRKRYL